MEGKLLSSDTLKAIRKQTKTAIKTHKLLQPSEIKTVILELLKINPRSTVTEIHTKLKKMGYKQKYSMISIHVKALQDRGLIKVKKPGDHNKTICTANLEALKDTKKNLYKFIDV